MDVIALLLDSLAAYRLSRLVTADTITAPVRDRLIAAAYRRAGKGENDETGAPVVDWRDYAVVDESAPKLATLLTCRFCASVWIGFGVVIARRRFPRAWSPIAEALALSAVAALLVQLED